MAKYLILKAPSVGLGSLMVTTICGKVYAQLTGRIPIVIWRQRCLYYEPTIEGWSNAFEAFFEPISDASIADILGQQYSYYPACWNDKNVLDDTLLQHNESAHFRLPVEPEFPGSEADILVVTEYPGITFYLPALLETYKDFQGLSELEVLSKYFQNQLELKPYLRQRIRDFQETHFKDQVSSIGLRIRRTDFAAVRAVPSDRMYINAVNARIASLNQPAKIFLATDCAKTAAKFKRIYGDQMCYTDCIRSETSAATHLSGRNQRLKGEQMLLDLYLLAECDYFIGSDSNWMWLVTRILNDPCMNADRTTSLNPTIGQKVWKQIELSSSAVLRSVVRRSRAVTRSLLKSAA